MRRNATAAVAGGPALRPQRAPNGVDAGRPLTIETEPHADPEAFSSIAGEAATFGGGDGRP